MNTIYCFTQQSQIGSDEVRQFTNWVTIPPPSLQISTSPSDITIRQGEKQLIPARIRSTSGFSNDVINITLGGTAVSTTKLKITILDQVLTRVNYL